MLTAEEIENWNGGYATDFDTSFTIDAGFSGEIVDITIGVYLVSGWVD